jgi:hypothetical protein
MIYSKSNQLKIIYHQMKTIFTVALIATINAKIHNHFAESNFACGMCQ